MGKSRKKDKDGRKPMGIKVPRKVLGFKLSKGTRKDLRKVLGLLENAETRTIAVSAAGAALTWIVEHKARRDEPLAIKVGKGSAPAQAH